MHATTIIRIRAKKLIFNIKNLFKVCQQGNCVNSVVLPKKLPCSSNPCLNGGTCVPINQLYLCRCAPKYTGKLN